MDNGINKTSTESRTGISIRLKTQQKWRGKTSYQFTSEIHDDEFTQNNSIRREEIKSCDAVVLKNHLCYPVRIKFSECMTASPNC